MAIDTEIIIKLFDTLKESNTSLASKVEKQTDALVALGNKLDKINSKTENMSKSFDEHSTTAKATNECTEETEEKVRLIWDKVKTMSKSVNTMIVVVCVAFGLLVMSYYFVRSNIETMIDKRIELTEKESIDHNKLTKEIEELKKQIERLRQ